MKYRLILCVLVLLGLSARGAPDPATQPLPANLSVENLLYAYGDKLDVYFTLEQDDRTGRSRLSRLMVPDPDGLKTPTDLVEYLQRCVPIASVFQDPTNKRVIHLVQKSLQADDYVMDRQTSIQFHGSIYGLVDDLASKSNGGVTWHTAIAIGTLVAGSDTLAQISAQNETYREILTDCSPLKDRARILWIGNLRPQSANRPLSVVIWFPGKPAVPHPMVPLANVLRAAGERLQVYFTIEEDWRPGAPWNGLGRTVQETTDLKSLDDVIAFVRGNYPGVRVIADSTNARIIHLVDGSLTPAVDPLDQSTSLDFEGDYPSFMGRIRDSSHQAISRAVARGTGDDGYQGMLIVKIHSANSPCRDVISDALPLEKSDHVLWVGRFITTPAKTFMSLHLTIPPRPPATTQSVPF
jgi:hypothetical protein